jgi:hypothetical protein
MGLKLPRGPEERLDSLENGQVKWTDDTEKFVIGGPSGNVELARKRDLDNLGNAISYKLNITDQKIFDIQSTPVSYYSTLGLPQGKIMQGFYFIQNGKYILANITDGLSPESFSIYRMASTGKLLDSMTLTNFGHGTVLGIEEDGTDTYIWTNLDNGNGTNSLARFKYTAGATYTSASPEVSIYLNFGSSEAVYPSVSGEYIIFCRNLGSGNSWSIEKRNLSDVKTGVNRIVQQMNVPVSHLYMQGFTVDGDTLYWLTGDSNGTNYPIKLTSFDLNTGNILVDQSVNFGEGSNGIAESNYKEPEGVFLYTDSSGAKSLFVGIVTGDTVTRYNKVFAYHSLLNANKFAGYKLQDVPFDAEQPWINAVYKNGAATMWSQPLQYRKKPGNKVQIRGAITCTSGSVVATLPFEYKPRYMKRFSCGGDGSVNSSRVSIDNGTGDISVTLGTSITGVFLDFEYDISLY